MAQKAIIMDQVKQVQQLHSDGVFIKEIARRIGVSRKTVKKYLRKLSALPPPTDDPSSPPITDKALAAAVYNNDVAPVGDPRRRALFVYLEVVKNELHKTGVTKQLLWVEYMTQQPDGFKYSQFCFLFRRYLKDNDPAFHWEYRPGEFTQIDFAGKKLSYVNKDTGEVIYVEVFVAILPYSGLIYCQGCRSQKTVDFAQCINNMVKYLEGLTLTILGDNMRTAVTRADPHEPVFTELCHQLSAHYNTTFSATRRAEPRDKAMVESAVNIVYQQIYAPMRKEVAGSLEELNQHIRGCLDKLNTKPYKGTQDSRRDIFERDEKPLLKPLPRASFQVRHGKQVVVQRNYAIQLPDNKHYYTVPYEHVGRQVQVYYDPWTVEVYYQHERIAFHVRTSTEPNFNRIHDHMPASHQHMVAVQGWTVEQLLSRAARVGAHTHQAAGRILHSSIYPEQNYKACHAMLLLEHKYSRERLEAACLRTANIIRPTLKLIRNILAAGLDRQPLLFTAEEKSLPPHPNIRGRDSYR